MAAGTLTVNVQARTARAVGNLKKFQKSARRTGRVARSSSRGVGMLGNKLKALGMAAGGAIAAGFTARTFFATAAGLQKLNDVSAKLGISVNHLRQLQHAANLTGVSTETLNMALQRQVRRIAEAAMGTGEAAAALKELGIDAKRLNQLSPYEQFRLISQAMEGIPNQADKVRLAFKLWDSEGAALVNTLRMGSKGLDRIRRRFQRLGLEFTEIKLKQVERFNEALAELALITEVFGQKIVISIAPGAALFAEALVEAIEGFRFIFKGIAGFFAANPWLGKLGSWIKTLAELQPFFLAQKGVLWASRKFAEMGMGGDATNLFDMVQNQVDAMWKKFISLGRGEGWFITEGIQMFIDAMYEDLRRSIGLTPKTIELPPSVREYFSEARGVDFTKPVYRASDVDEQGQPKPGASPYWRPPPDPSTLPLPPHRNWDNMPASEQLKMARRTIAILDSIDSRTREQNEDLRRAKETVVRLGVIP